MKVYRYKIQTLIHIDIKAENKEEARLKIVDRLQAGAYDDQLSNDAYVSDGKEIK